MKSSYWAGALLAVGLLIGCGRDHTASHASAAPQPTPPQGDAGAAPAVTVADILAPLVSAKSPGAAVLVVRDGKIEHQAGYGLADVERGTPITAETLFHLGSTGKQFTALAVMLLKEEGKLSYDDPIGKHLPELSRLGEAVTIRRLLHHTSGMPNSYPALYAIAELNDGKRLPTNADSLLILSKWGEPRFPPGERFAYSNTGYDVLGAMIERISGKSFEDFVRTRIFDPLEMNKTFSMPDPKRLVDPLRAKGYQRFETGFSLDDSDPLDHIVGSGSIFSNLADLYRYDQALYSDKLVSQMALTEAYRPALLNDGSTSPYGFAQSLGEHKGHRYLKHGGRWVGYVAMYVRFPDEKLSVIVLWNRNDVDSEEIAFRIADLYLKKE
jgi:CubicO group peptidase (beta-lactamase class C family)